MTQTTVPIVGMACAACAANVERRLSKTTGVESATVSLPGRSAQIVYDETVVSLPDLKRELNAIGFDMVIETGRSIETIERREQVLLRRKTLLAWCLSLLVMALSMGWLSVGGRDAANQVSLVLALVCMAGPGRSSYVHAWQQARHGMASMETLVSLSTVVAFLFSVFNTFRGDAVWGCRGMAWHTWYDASTMIIAFMLTGKMIEERARRGMAGSIRQLMGLQPETARIVRTDGDEEQLEQVPLSTIVIGDLLEVHPGEKVPVDGTVAWAESFMTADGAYVDESMLTGEPTPVLKQRGTAVCAGTMLQQGRLRFRARQVGEHTALAQMIQMVQQAQGSKAPVQRVVDKASRVFVPVVVGLSLLTFLLWWLLTGTDHLPQAILSAVSVLVIACPCAMGLATPAAIMVGIGRAANQHILVKDAAALERLRKITALVIDKTGTLTIPNQQVDFTKADTLPLKERETLKPYAREAMEQLQQRGVEVWMMSGDKQEAASYWADKAGIARFRSQAQPQDKEMLVKELQQAGHCVAMVGDGINDTQALALADVSIAMGRGTDVAMDVAQMTMMGDDLRRIPEAMDLSRKTVNMIGQNLFWAFAYNLVCIPLAAGLPHVFGLSWQITPVWASALMAFSSVSVVLNSLRLRYIQL